MAGAIQRVPVISRFANDGLSITSMLSSRSCSCGSRVSKPVEGMLFVEHFDSIHGVLLVYRKVYPRWSACVVACYCSVLEVGSVLCYLRCYTDTRRMFVCMCEHVTGTEIVESIEIFFFLSITEIVFYNISTKVLSNMHRGNSDWKGGKGGERRLWKVAAYRLGGRLEKFESAAFRLRRSKCRLTKPYLFANCKSFS